ncbi:bifunctional 2-polyprenyl-6-hydroxyphenol methylase/3-demethylubiquinol 3-O-methyltransferase UbiG [Acetobacteraceae bacterium KSS8]|uniref:Ubiquinone biosynthesis O-methyltransferase n=1 Tax=Endosaccharibacter trunci TaxID=2812733 RepID=A0ABT1W4N4_9PROT|nr:bifunctional 2-polyprenyl-6-hydroxyphenol methylase/3-demethylubiquinol 3-O-methyltransferase UbiG [Acetobacteraceae bacterium KSS8]
MQQPQTSLPSTVSPDEIARFGRLAAEWWDPRGPMRPLHAMNPLRIGWAEARLSRLRPAEGERLRVLDLGCGAGLASEALAARGFDVLGVDASGEAIEAAQAHAALGGWDQLGGALRYRACGGEALREEGAVFDAVCALEVIEHTTDPAGFLRLIASLLRPGGVAIVSTLNRTLRSLAAAKIGAEYVARLLPIGTHDWRRFVTPAELQRQAAVAGLRVSDIAGMTPRWGNPSAGWRESRDLSVNYIAALAAD